MSKKSLIIISIIFLISFGLVSNVFAVTAGEVKEQINDINDQIEALDKDIAKYQNQITETSQQKDSLNKTIQELTLTRSKLLAERNQIQKKINATSLIIKEIGTTIETKEQSIEKSRASLKKMLYSLYQRESESFVERILSKETLEDISREYNNTVAINEDVRNYINELNYIKGELSNTKTQKLEEQEKLDAYRREQLTEETGNRISDLVRWHLLEERDSNGISELERRLAAEEFSLTGEEEIQRQLGRAGGEEYNRQHPEEIKAILRRAARGEDLSEGEVRELEFYRNTPGLRQQWPWLDRVINENRRGGLGQSEEEILQFSYDSELGGLESFYMHIINDRRAGRRITNEAVLDRLLELRRRGFPDREALPIGYGEQLEEGIDNYIQESREEIENLRKTLRFGAGGVEP